MFKYSDRGAAAITRPYTALVAAIPRITDPHDVSGAMYGARSSVGNKIVVEQVRTNVRVHYRPNVYKRHKKHGLEKRLSTRRSLVMLWRRVIKGRHVLST